METADNNSADNTGADNRPLLWILDGEQGQIAACADAFAEWAECELFPWGERTPDWENPPHAIFFSAEIPGGANSDFFAELADAAGDIPLIAVARLRSLAQAVGYFRAGAADYLPFPLEEKDARERFEACIERAAKRAVQNMIEVETLESAETAEEEDILAQVPPEPPAPEAEAAEVAPRVQAWPGSGFFVNDMPLPAFPSREPAGDGEGGEDDFEEEIPDNLLFADAAAEEDAEEAEEPVAVDGLPIPALWEELPCGLIVFDSLGNLVFSNRQGLEFLGHESLADLQEALENNPRSFAAHGVNHRPLAANQWPHVLAVKSRAARSAVVSVLRRDGRRAWLRADCLPHLSDGKVARLTMTLVNLTGELPPLRAGETEEAGEAPGKKKKRRGRKR